MSRPDPEALRLVSELLCRIQGRHHPGRPAFYALAHAIRAVDVAARELRTAEAHRGLAGGAAAE